MSIAKGRNNMESVLKVEKLNKQYPTFSLKDVSFEVKPGEIMGFIGRNGAGKTTTLKSIMNLIHYESGNISAFGLDMTEHELENKQRIGFALSELNYYPNKTIRDLMNVTKRFYKNFDEQKFNEVCKLFGLDINKKLEELSSGMKVKYSVSIALSHKAELLILDEPTSGLDPVSRDEILDIFREIVKNKDINIITGNFLPVNIRFDIGIQHIKRLCAYLLARDCRRDISANHRV